MTKVATKVVAVRATLSETSRQRIAFAREWRKAKGEILEADQAAKVAAADSEDMVIAELTAELPKATSAAEGRITPATSSYRLWRFRGEDLERLPDTQAARPIWNHSTSTGYQAGDLFPAHRDFARSRFLPMGNGGAVPTNRYPSGAALFAEREALPADTWVDIWGGAANRRPLLAAAENLEIVSTNAANTAAGTGVRSVRLLLMDSAGLVSVQTVATNGTTPVPVPGGPYIRSLYVRSDEVGSYGWVEGGPVSLRTVAASTDLDVMRVDTNESRTGAWVFTQDQHPWGVVAWETHVSESAKTPVIRFELQIREVASNQAWITIDASPELDENDRHYSVPLIPWTSKDAITPFDVRLSARTSLADARVQGKFTFVQKEPGIASLNDILP